MNLNRKCSWYFEQLANAENEKKDETAGRDPRS